MSPTLRIARHRRTAGLIAAVLALGVVPACGTEQPHRPGAAAVVEKDKDGLIGTLVEPPLRLVNVTLRDTDQKPTRLADFSPGKATALFFGFTNCDDVCPTTMADLASARRALPADLAHRVAVVFVTVDPSRDTPAVLRRWLDQFDTTTVGLRGPERLVHTAERSLYADQSSKASTPPTAAAEPDGHQREHAQGSTPGKGGDYEVNHSGSVYVFGPSGETVLYSGGTTPAQYSADFKRLLGSSR